MMCSDDSEEMVELYNGINDLLNGHSPRDVGHVLMHVMVDFFRASNSTAAVAKEYTDTILAAFASGTDRVQ
jgi:hypothetical protein